MIRNAASADPDIGALWARIQASTSRAADILWALNHPILYALRAGERGWSPEWLGDLVCSQLLAL